MTNQETLFHIAPFVDEHAGMPPESMLKQDHLKRIARNGGVMFATPDGKCLLGKHNVMINGSLEELWAPFAGHKEGGETIEICSARECLEESGQLVEVGDQTPKYFLIKEARKGWKVGVVYIKVVGGNDLKLPQSTAEVDGFIWFEPEEVYALANFYPHQLWGDVYTFLALKTLLAQTVCTFSTPRFIPRDQIVVADASTVAYVNGTLLHDENRVNSYLPKSLYQMRDP